MSALVCECKMCRRPSVCVRYRVTTAAAAVARQCQPLSEWVSVSCSSKLSQFGGLLAPSKVAVVVVARSSTQREEMLLLLLMLVVTTSGIFLLSSFLSSFRAAWVLVRVWQVNGASTSASATTQSLRQTDGQKATDRSIWSSLLAGIWSALFLLLSFCPYPCLCPAVWICQVTLIDTESISLSLFLSVSASS